MTRRVLRLAAPVLGALLGAACGPGASHGATGGEDELAGKLVLTGSSTIAPLAAELAKRFELEHPGVRVDVQSGGSGRGIADARSGAADIGMASRAMAADELDLQVFTIARDGVCPIVHRDNPVRSLSDDEIVAIYTGEIRNWRDVGGLDAPITVVNKAEGRATLEVFLGYFHLENSQIHADVVIGENEQGIKTVAGNRDAIGYVSIGTAEADEESGVAIASLPVRGVAATTANVATGAFPLSRPLNLVTAAPPTGLARAFIDFARSSRVHDLVTAQYFVPLAD